MIKLNNNGILQWVSIFSGISGGQTHSYIPRGIAISNDGNSIYYTTQCINSSSQNNFVTLKYDSYGDSIWLNTFPDGFIGSWPSTDPATIKLDKYNNVYVTGYDIYPHYVSIKYSPNGVQQWVTIYTDNQGMTSDLSIDTNLNIYVTGTTSNGHQATTIKYNQLLGIKPNSNEIPNKFSLSQNYPNPFNPSSKIKFSIPLSRGLPAEHSQAGVSKGWGVLTSLKIYDILGREVAMLVNENLQSGTYDVTFDGSDYASGVYFYKLKAGDYSETKKMVLMK